MSKWDDYFERFPHLLDGTCAAGLFGQCGVCSKGWRNSKKRYRVTINEHSRLAIRRDRWRA